MKTLLIILFLFSFTVIETIAQTKENLRDTVITGIEDDFYRSITIYPNPSQSSVSIAGEFDEAVVLNMNLEQVATFTRSVTVNNFNPGLYIVRIVKDKTVINKKLIVGNSE